ncbi:unnamed protein product [Vitrella brassicaformis CCMP3155]|uniref:Uncharacterized protein n=2 Tax=Vitrella brassicaformis TaxID=1169539 RepID=A0A0G4E9W9_VITBC|nr:unnamed protein product [Vitrella brassicaformis CCMP3155]|eukprot:CEL91999.1 unnamed protein product [Vitrella brassicaformis CCMP3155]
MDEEMKRKILSLAYSSAEEEEEEEEAEQDGDKASPQRRNYQGRGWMAGKVVPFQPSKRDDKPRRKGSEAAVDPVNTTEPLGDDSDRPLREGEVDILCEDGTKRVQRSIFSPHERSPLHKHLFGTDEGLRGSLTLPCQRWLIDALDFFAYYKNLPKMSDERQDELLAFADYFCLDSIVNEFERKREQRERAKAISERHKSQRREYHQKLSRKYEKHSKQFLHEDVFAEIGRMRGVLPQKMTIHQYVFRGKS